MKPRVLLAILDGLGLREEEYGNAVKQANTPNLDKYLADYSDTTLRADGEFVGLPEGQMGNSEVGHLNIGAGRVVYQSLALINKDIEDRTFFKNDKYLAAIKNAKDNNSGLHILGLLSDGGVHAHINHIKAMIQLAQQEEVNQIYVHAILDGRDVAPKSAKKYLDMIEKLVAEGNENTMIATVTGRYYSMDRDKRWERVERAYDAIVLGEGNEFSSPDAYIESQYEKGITDEFIEPASNIAYQGSKDNDSFVFMNFRPDRAIQLSAVLTNPDYDPKPEDNPIFKPKYRPQNIYFVQTMKYSNDVIGELAYAPRNIANPLGDVLAKNGKKQLRIAETEKYPHVTFFFDGGEEKELEGAKRILIPSPQVATYDLKPEMSAYELTDELVKELKDPELDAVILNFANPDMVGHSGMLEPTVAAIEAVDENLGRIVETGLENGWSFLITADHGNSDKVLNEDGSPNTAHTTNPVPLVLVDSTLKLRPEMGSLRDLAPTILDILGVEQPEEMTGHSLIERKED